MTYLIWNIIPTSHNTMACNLSKIGIFDKRDMVTMFPNFPFFLPMKCKNFIISYPKIQTEGYPLNGINSAIHLWSTFYFNLSWRPTIQKWIFLDDKVWLISLVLDNTFSKWLIDERKHCLREKKKRETEKKTYSTGSDRYVFK